MSFPVQNIHVCLGSLFVPEAYITATRQYVAQANSWSLEELCLEVNVTTAQGAALDACSFGIKGQLTSHSSILVYSTRQGIGYSHQKARINHNTKATFNIVMVWL